MEKKIHSILYIGVVLLLTSVGNSQDKLRTVEKGKYTYHNEPLVIVSRELGNRPFLNDTQVKGDQNWLKDLRLGIKNISKKTITYFDIELVIEKQGRLTSKVSISLEFGRSEPILDATGKSTGEYRRKVLNPGEIVKVSVSDNKVLFWGKYLKENEAADFDSVSVDIREVDYDDGTGWTLGDETREDPNYPGSRVRISRPSISRVPNFR